MVYLRILIVVVSVNLSFGQNFEQENLPSRFIADARLAAAGSIHVITSPFSWNSKDWTIFGTFACATAVSFLMDRNIRDIFQRNKGKFADELSRFGEIYGEPITVVLLTGGIYAYGLFLDNPEARKTAILMTMTLIPGGMAQTISKITAGRARPLTGEGHDTFKPFSRTEDYYSFVSGHTLVAMSISQVLAKQVQSTPAKIALYSLGVIGGMSRLYDDEHWFSDILLAAVLSYACVASADNWIKQSTNKTRTNAGSFFIHLTSTNISVSFQW